MIHETIGRYGRAIDSLDRAMMALSSTIMALVVLLTAAEIVTRNVFGFSSPEGVDLTLSLAVLSYFIGYVVLLNRDQDVTIDYFYRKFPASVQRLVDAAIAIAILTYFLVLATKSFTLFRMGINSLHPVFPVPHGVVALPILIGAWTCVFVALRRMLDALVVVVDGGSSRR